MIYLLRYNYLWLLGKPHETDLEMKKLDVHDEVSNSDLKAKAYSQGRRLKYI